MNDLRNPPPGTSMAQLYAKYKDLDGRANAAEKDYKQRLKTTKVPKKDIQRDKSFSTANKVPLKYQRQPLGTREWHQETAQYAKVAADEYDA